MTLENQVVSLELAKKLKELGFAQDSLFYWWVNTFGLNKEEAVIENHKPNNPQGGWTYFSAYTVAELGEFDLKNYPLPILNQEKKWIIPINGFDKFLGIAFNTEADARASLLIYLKANNLI